MKVYIKIIIHSIYWVVFMGITVASITFNNMGIDPRHGFPHIVINTVWAGVIFYLFYFYFITYFEKGKFIRYLLISIVSSAIITILFIPFHKIFIPDFQVFTNEMFFPSIIGTFIIAQCGSLVKGFENWVDNIKLKAELENRNLKNELELLKSQINPHFLFNTLNNIDALIHKSPDDASRSLLSLSDMLRYMIYETNTEFVTVEKEIEYLENYIKLQRLRLRNPEVIKMSLSKECRDIKIAPVLFLPFVENAFKYAVSEGILPAIEIDLSCSNGQLIFLCKNYYAPNGVEKIEWGGVGLENVKRRLELIYPKKHEFSIRKENGIFSVELKLDC